MPQMWPLSWVSLFLYIFFLVVVTEGLISSKSILSFQKKSPLPLKSPNLFVFFPL